MLTEKEHKVELFTVFFFFQLFEGSPGQYKTCHVCTQSKNSNMLCFILSCLLTFTVLSGNLAAWLVREFCGEIWWFLNWPVCSHFSRNPGGGNVFYSGENQLKYNNITKEKGTRKKERNGFSEPRKPSFAVSK